MSKSRRPNQATKEEIEEFFDRTKSILGKTGLYYDPITKKFRKAITQNGKTKGSGRELKLEKKFAGYLRKIGDGEDSNILKDASARAIDKGFSALQKERKAFLKAKLETKPTAEEEASAPKKKTGELRGRNKQEDKQVKKKKKIPDAPKQTLLNQKVQEKKQKTAVAEGVREIVGERAKGLEKMAKNIRMEVIEEGEEQEERQKEKIQEVQVQVEGTTNSLEEASGEVDDAKLGNLRGTEQQPQAEAQQEEPQAETEAEQEAGVKGEVPLTQPDTTPPPIPRAEDRVVEEIKPAPIPTQSSAMVAPSSQKVSMERNRMKYSPEKLRAEIKAFITIYRDDIKTPRFKQLANTKLDGLSLDKLRQLHRNIEEEVIEYYGKQTGLRLGVIIDPSVLGLSVQRLQGVLAPQLNLPTAPVVRDVGSIPRDITGGRQLTQSADTHYHVGGIQQATKQVMPEGQNLQETSQGQPQATPDRKADKTRIKIPIKPPMRHLFQPTRRARVPANIVIRG